MVIIRTAAFIRFDSCFKRYQLTFKTLSGFECGPSSRALHHRATSSPRLYHYVPIYILHRENHGEVLWLVESGKWRMDCELERGSSTNHVVLVSTCQIVTISSQISQFKNRPKKELTSFFFQGPDITRCSSSPRRYVATKNASLIPIFSGPRPLHKRSHLTISSIPSSPGIARSSRCRCKMAILISFQGIFWLKSRCEMSFSSCCHFFRYRIGHGHECWLMTCHLYQGCPGRRVLFKSFLLSKGEKQGFGCHECKVGVNTVFWVMERESTK